MNCARAFAYYMLCACALVLSGCAHNQVQPEPVIVIQKEYVLRIPPADLITLPAPVPKMDLTDQGEVAKWIVLQMERMSTLENKLTGVAKFLHDEANKLHK